MTLFSKALPETRSRRREKNNKGKGKQVTGFIQRLFSKTPHLLTPFWRTKVIYIYIPHKNKNKSPSMKRNLPNFHEPNWGEHLSDRNFALLLQMTSLRPSLLVKHCSGVLSASSFGLNTNFLLLYQVWWPQLRGFQSTALFTNKENWFCKDCHNAVPDTEAAEVVGMTQG